MLSYDININTFLLSQWRLPMVTLILAQAGFVVKCGCQA